MNQEKYKVIVEEAKKITDTGTYRAVHIYCNEKIEMSDMVFDGTTNEIKDQVARMIDEYLILKAETGGEC